MTTSVITALAPNNSELLFGEVPYLLEIKGQPEPRVKVTELNNWDLGVKTVRIVAMAAEGVPALPLPTLDQIARRILPGARVKASLKGRAGLHREYAVPVSA